MAMVSRNITHWGNTKARPTTEANMAARIAGIAVGLHILRASAAMNSPRGRKASTMAMTK